ncbi:MAG: carboxypeptidase-like regulatory domain-containing protein, partial [Saprospiraceae bacterium]|nr:carboxypeptidase-like regulatory domain-containing protein [Saprospiraceae bacterium]
MKLKLLMTFLCLVGLSYLQGSSLLAASEMSGEVAPFLTVTGTVTDEAGDPLPGATVLVKGTTNGTVSDFDGSFSLEVNEGDILVFSFTGYGTQEVPVGTQTVFNVTLLEEASALDEVVVVGYGIQKKRDVTGAISTVDNEQIEKIPVASGVQAMQGQVAGVDILSTGGRPGQAPTIKIRGRRSISASNDPLFVIDGIPQTSGTAAITDINPQDIASMEVLKDA